MSCLVVVVLVLVKRHKNVGRFCLFVQCVQQFHFGQTVIAAEFPPHTVKAGSFQLLMIVFTKFKEPISDLILYVYIHLRSLL